MKFLKSLPKDKLQKLILVIIVSLIAVGCVFNFYVLKQITTIAEKNAEIKKLNDQITGVQREVKEEVANTRLREQLQGFITAQEQRMVDGDAYSWIVREMALFGEKHPVRVTGLTPSGKTPMPNKPQFELYTIRLEVTGVYDELGRFLSDLENTYPTCSIRNLGMGVADTARGESRINLDLSLLVRPKATAGKADPAKKKAA